MHEQLARCIGSTARAARLDARLTQADVAERVGLAVESYGRIERGTMLPSVGTLQRMSVALAVSSDKLLGLSEARACRAPSSPSDDDESPEIRRLLRRARELNKRGLRLLLLTAALLPRSGGGRR